MRDPSLHILQHALGLDDYGHGNPYRNHFVAGEECASWPLLMAHVEAGRMQQRYSAYLRSGCDMDFGDWLKQRGARG